MFIKDNAIIDFDPTKHVVPCPICGGSGGAIGDGTEFPCHSSSFGDQRFYLWYDGSGFDHADDCASVHETLEAAIAEAESCFQAAIKKITVDAQGVNVVWKN